MPALLDVQVPRLSPDAPAPVSFAPWALAIIVLVGALTTLQRRFIARRR